jgi:hypothetical protein
MHMTRFIGLFLVLIVAAVSIGNAATVPTIKSNDIKIALDPDNGQLLVIGRFDATKPATLTSFYVSLTSNAQIRTVSVIKGDVRYDLASTPTGGDSLFVKLPDVVKADTSINLEFQYTISIGQKPGSIMILDRSNRWYPAIPDQLAPFHLAVQVPELFDVFACGNFISENVFPDYTEYLWESKIPVARITLVIAKPDQIQSTERACDGIKVFFLSDTLDNDIADEIADDACGMLSYYQDLIGPYQYSGLRLVRVLGLRATIVSAGLILFGERITEKARSGDLSIVTQAIASQWFGAGVYAKPGAEEYWLLTISLPYYLQMMYQRAKFGDEAYDKCLQEALAAYEVVANTSDNIPISQVNELNSRAKFEIIQNKASYVISRIVKQIGEENWVKVLRALYLEYKGKDLPFKTFSSYLSKNDPTHKAAEMLNKMLTEKTLTEN